jgi:hypothetical protein
MTLYALVKMQKNILGQLDVEEVVIGHRYDTLRQEGDEWMGGDSTDGYFYGHTFAITNVTLAPEIVAAMKGVEIPCVDPAIVGALRG